MATTMRWNHRGGLVGTLVDAAVPRFPHMEGRLRAVQKIHGDAETDIRAARVNAELTPFGQEEASRRARARADEALAPHEDEAARLDAQAASLRARAAATPAPERSELRALFADREIRDRLAGMDPLLILPRYLSAIDRGDWAFARAVENAPAAFPLLTSEGRRQGDAAKIRRSPFRDELERLEGERDTLRSVVNAARAELEKLARDHGFDAA